jgi:hypothetical protein
VHMEMIITARLSAMPYTEIFRIGRAMVFCPLESTARRLAMNNSVFKYNPYMCLKC